MSSGKKALGVPLPDENTPHGKLYLVALRDESERRKRADEELSREVHELRSDVTELGTTLRTDVSELRADVLKLALSPRGKLAFGGLVSGVAIVLPEVVKIVKHLMGI